jgi:hypothetical protein
MIKNLMALTDRAPVANPAIAHELTQREAKKLAATAETRADHLKLAAYYKAQADKLNGQDAGYEQAAATYRHGPFVKNLMAPNTPGRYEFYAKSFREGANSNLKLAASHDQMAGYASAGL